ncbi:hypothetical protein HYR99_38600 [Candidatus Poribacteria bacterium]|nr:hypothetical protein [Candidatus Poribacteria bacterium]
MELDQFMKELVVDFLEDIMALFFPRLARRLDFSQKRDLNKQLYTHSPKGVERFIDVLIEVVVKNPPPEVLLIHIESQQRKRFDFPARMFVYPFLIYAREIESERQETFSLADFMDWQNRKQILSFAFCNYSLQKGITRERYQIGSPQTRLSCQYTCISLPMLSAREYLRKKRAVVCALAVLMNPAGLSPPDLKAACYRKLIPFLPNLTKQQFTLIAYAVETYVTLSEEEKQVYQHLIQEVYPEVSEMITNPLIERGRQQGAITAKQETLIELMQLRFGTLPQLIIQRIQSIQEIEQLNTFLRRVITATRLEGMGIENGSGTRQG